jgi:hypothetical protein
LPGLSTRTSTFVLFAPDWVVCASAFELVPPAAGAVPPDVLLAAVVASLLPWVAPASLPP